MQTDSMQHAADNMHHATEQHATDNMQHATCHRQHATDNMQHAAGDTRQASCNRLHATDDSQPGSMLQATRNIQQTIARPANTLTSHRGTLRAALHGAALSAALGHLPVREAEEQVKPFLLCGRVERP